MRRMRFKTLMVITVAGVSLWVHTAQAQVNAGVLFLRIAAGARPAGMGEAFVAIANDATATHWNPAGLGTYPLNSEWTEHALPAVGAVLDAVAIKNDLPFKNFVAYDLWVLTDRGLVRFGPSGAKSGEENSADAVELPTEGVGSVVAAIRRYAPFLSEDDADAIGKNAAVASLGASVAEVESLLTRVRDAIPADYHDRSTLENIVRDFRAAVFEGRIESGRLPEVRTAIAALPESAPADPLALDRVRFALERSVSPALPRSVWVGLNDLIRLPIRAIVGDGDNLYVAAADGLLIFDGERWDRVTPPADVDWNVTPINCLALVQGSRLWVGTDGGIFVRQSGQWQKFGTGEGLPSMRVLKLAIINANSGWAYTDAGLAYYNGTAFSSSEKIAVNVGEDLTAVLKRFLDTEDDVAAVKAADAVRTANNLAADFAPAAGAEIDIPFHLGLRGEVTTLIVDSYDRLWVGTTLGAFRFSKDHWTSFGYEPYVAPEATTAQALAEARLGTRATPARTQRLAEYISGYNGLENGQIPAGRKIYVYRNPAGAHVFDIAADGEHLYVATEVGQLEVASGEWGRYYHRDLDRDQVRTIVSKGGDVWFVTDTRVVIYQRAHKELSWMHVKWLPEFDVNLYYEYLSYVTNVEGVGTLGTSVTFLSYGEVERTDELGRRGLPFNPFELAFAVSYGTRLNPSLAAGMSAKVVYSRLSDQGAGAELGSGSATAFALDAGFLYETPWRRLTLGGALTNLGPNISYIDAQQSDPLPRNLAAGFAYRLWDTPYNKFTLIGELNKELVSLGDKKSSELKQIIYNVGAEYWYGSMVAARGGYIHDEDGNVKTLTFGGGLSYQGFQIDFAYIPSTRENQPLANTLRIGVTGRF